MPFADFQFRHLPRFIPDDSQLNGVFSPWISRVRRICESSVRLPYVNTSTIPKPDNSESEQLLSRIHAPGKQVALGETNVQ
jgi:hypothetical protein